MTLLVENTTITQDVDFLSYLLRQMPGMIVVMDRQSRFLYSNDYTAKLFGYPNEESMLGDNAHQIHCPAVACADDFIQQDQFVMEKRAALTMLDIHAYADSQEKIFLANKVPFIMHGELVGSICHCTKIQPSLLGRISASLMRSDHKYYTKDKQGERSYCVDTLLADTCLAKREMDCLFYLLRGKTMKEIAIALDISWRTVESYLYRIKSKWGCEKKNDIVDYAIANGFLNYIPKEILSGNISQILEASY